MYTLEQLEILMLVAESNDPYATAVEIRRRWTYIHGLAVCAARGIIMDTTLLQVIQDHTTYARKAQLILSALDEWIEEHQRKAAS